MKFWENDLNKILLFLLVVLVIFLGFIGCGAYQLQTKNTSGEDNREKQPSENFNALVDTNLCWQISQLRAENVELKKQLDSMENKIKHEKKAVDDLKGEIAFWFSFGSILVTAITMIVAIIAIVVPLYNVSEIKEKQKEVEAELEKQRNQTKNLQTLAESAKKQATLATQAAKEAKNSSEHMQTQVEYVSAQAKQAEQAANDAKAIQIFILALKEPNPENALHLYEILINEYGSFYGIYEAYFQRGILKYKMNDLAGAISEFDNAISINQGYAMAYRNRGLLNPNRSLEIWHVYFSNDRH